MKIAKNKNGFSLLELAAVMTIISLIVTFVIKSTNLSGNAKLDSIMADVRYYAKQADRFEEIYGGIAGDFANYTSLPNYNVAPTASAGNGNGFIDSVLINESLQYWLHLQKAGLINGYYDGASTNTGFDPQQPGTAGGYPLLRYPGAILTVSNNIPYGLTYTVSGISSSNYTTALLTPLSAYNLDKKYDDGNPDTGIIRAIDGSNVSANSCRTANTYTLATTSASCYLNFYIDSKNTSSSATTPYSYGSCDGYNFGSTRISSTTTCATGYNGYYYENCTNLSSNSGWSGTVLTQSYCNPVSCGMGLTYGQTITMPCIPGFQNTNFGNSYNNPGTSLTYTCGQYGILYPSSTSSCSNTAASTGCTGSSSQTFTCPIGYSGTYTLTCSSGSVVSTFATGCTANAIKCSGNNLGSSIATGVASPCPTGWVSKATATSACALPVTASSSTTTGQPILVQTYCAADYSACSTVGATRSGTACPYGQTGTYTQKCNGSYYVTTVNTCTPVTCGGEPVGSWRAVSDSTCSGKGSVIEICMYTDATISSCSSGCHAAQWMRSYAGCN